MSNAGAVIGIIAAVLIATGVGFWQEYDAKKKFDAMKTDKDYELVKVRRNGNVIEVSKDQLVVGDVVLLSPACASFDHFKDFAHRGNHFKELVNEL